MKWKSKWPIYAGILILVIFVIYGFVIWWSFEDGGDRGTFGDMFGAVNALFSGLAFAGVLYTINLQRRDSSLNIMPLLSVDTVREGRDLRLEVVNIGNGTAINIGFSDAVLEGGIFEFKVEDIRYLKPGDKVVMAITTYGGEWKWTNTGLLIWIETTPIE